MYHHLLRRTAAPAAACLFSATILEDMTTQKSKSRPSSTRLALNKTLCDAKSPKTEMIPNTITSSGEKLRVSAAVPSAVPPAPSAPSDNPNDQLDDTMYQNLFPLRQLSKPNVEYPLWDDNWDGKISKSVGSTVEDVQRKRFIRKNGVTRHIILVRHGQYDESHKEDSKRILTPLGREQADLTGQRLAELIKGIDKQFGPCNIKTLRVSNMARAKETADIIGQHLPESVQRSDPDPNLNEGRPCHHIPGGKASKHAIAKTDEGHERIEAAFGSYFYRADEPPVDEGVNGVDGSEDKKDGGGDSDGNSDGDGDDALATDPKHEFEIIVCHANVIRYFLCRALQIPPEAWLRLCTFNCSLTYLTIRPTGTVSCRMLGDIGHLGYDHSTFSMHHGFNW